MLDSHEASGAVCAGSNPAGGTQHEVPKDPVTSGNAEAGVFLLVQACVARSGRMSGFVDEAWVGSEQPLVSWGSQPRCLVPTSPLPSPRETRGGVLAAVQDADHVVGRLGQGWG
jgi:hypothetical protein